MPTAIGEPVELVAPDGTLLSGSVAAGGERTAVLMHGLTAHRGLVLMGSRKLQREGWTVIAFDARGHGNSGPAAPGSDYGYGRLIEDAEAILARFAPGPAVLVGVSMGAHTAAGLAIARPDLCRAMVLITPAWRGSTVLSPTEAERWLGLADALESDGIEGFIGELAESGPQGRWSELASVAARQRMGSHLHLDAVAAALRDTPLSKPFQSLDSLQSLRLPTLVVGSRDEADPGHPVAVAQDWAQRIPGARFELEGEGESPLAWRGASIADFALSLAEGP
ncbi:MAG: alpha/beta hydrolase [Actinomycetes bacterium]